MKEENGNFDRVGQGAAARLDLAIAALLFVVVVAGHWKVVTQFWLWDDPQFLFGLQSASLADFFFLPEVWRTQSSTNFVPLLIAAYGVDFSLFGYDPLGYYAHHLVVFAASIVSVYLLLATFARRLFAFLAAATLGFSAAGVNVVSILPNRHYAFGLLFSCLALYVFRASRRSAGAMLGAFFYFLACLSKEVFVPLPALLILLVFAGTPLRRTVRDIALCGVALLVYLPWRMSMLGSFGGYGRGRTRGELASLPAELWSAICGDAPVAAVVFALLAAAITLTARAKPLVLVATAATVGVVISVPLVPLLGVSERHAFAGTSLLLFFLAIAASRSEARMMTALFTLLCTAVVAAGLSYRTGLARENDVMQREGRYIWSAPAGSRTLFASSHIWYVEGMRWLRHHVRGDAGPGVIGSVEGMLLSGRSPENVVSFTMSDRDITRQFARARESYRLALPYRVVVRGDLTRLEWEFDPAEGHEWYFAPMPLMNLIRVVPHSWLRLPIDVRPPTSATDPAASHFRVILRTGAEWTATEPIRFPRKGEVLTVP